MSTLSGKDSEPTVGAETAVNTKERPANTSPATISTLNKKGERTDSGPASREAVAWLFGLAGYTRREVLEKLNQGMPNRHTRNRKGQ